MSARYFQKLDKLLERAEAIEVSTHERQSIIKALEGAQRLIPELIHRQRADKAFIEMLDMPPSQQKQIDALAYFARTMGIPADRQAEAVASLIAGGGFFFVRQGVLHPYAKAVAGDRIVRKRGLWHITEAGMRAAERCMGQYRD